MDAALRSRSSLRAARISARSVVELRPRRRPAGARRRRAPARVRPAAEARTRSISASSSATRASERSLRLLRRGTCRGRAVAFRGGVLLRRLCLGQELGHPAAFGGDERRRLLDTLARQAEARGDAQRVRRARPSESDAVERRLGLRVEARRRVRRAFGRARPLLELRVVARGYGEPRLAGEPTEERLREGGALDRVGAGRDLVEEHERACRSRVEDRDEVPHVAGERREAHRRSTARRRCRRAPRRRPAAAPSRAGGRRPHWWSSAASPSVFSATVLPPVFGPETTTRAQVAELEVDRNGVRRVEQRVTRAEQDDLVGDLDGGAAPARATAPHARARGRSRAMASTSVAQRPGLRRRPTARELARGCARPRRARRSPPRGAVVRVSTTANGSTKSVWPEPELSWTMPGTAPRALACSASTGRPPRSVTKSSCRWSRRAGSRASERSRSPSRARPSRELAPEAAQGGRGAVAEIRAVVLDGLSYRARRRLRGAARSLRQRQSGAGSAVRRRAPRARRARRRSTSPTACSAAGSRTPPRVASSTAGRTSWAPARSGSADCSSTAIASAVRPAPNDLVGVGRRRQRAGQSRPGSLVAVAARRSRIAGSSRSSSARGSIAAV